MTSSRVLSFFGDFLLLLNNLIIYNLSLCCRVSLFILPFSNVNIDFISSINIILRSFIKCICCDRQFGIAASQALEIYLSICIQEIRDMCRHRQALHLSMDYVFIFINILNSYYIFSSDYLAILSEGEGECFTTVLIYSSSI